MKKQAKTRLLAESIDGNSLKWPLAKGSFKPDVVYLIDDMAILKSQRTELWNILQKAYEKVGGYKGHDNPRTWFKDIDCIKLVLASNGSIAAFAAYTTHLDGRKRFCSAKNSDVVKNSDAVRSIIDDDIIDYDGFYWVEASGGIEQIFKEMNGNPIPNIYAREFLELGKESKIELMPDGVHYKRQVGKSHDVLEKMIFGFKTKELAMKICSNVASYEEFKLAANAKSVVEAFHMSESEDAKTVSWALAIARKMHELANEWQCHEMLPTWNTLMREAKAVLERAYSIEEDHSRKQMIKSNLNTVKYCLHDMVLLKVHVFDAKKALAVSGRTTKM